MFSQQLLDKWRKLLKKKGGFKNPTPQEVFEFANTFTNFFDLLIRFDLEDKIKDSEKRKDEKR